MFMLTNNVGDDFSENTDGDLVIADYNKTEFCKQNSTSRLIFESDL